MKIKVLQNSVGCYNLLAPTDREFKFTLAICNEEGVIKDETGNKCLIHYSGKENEKDRFDYYVDELDITSIFLECLEHAKKVRSTEAYKDHAIFFFEVFAKNAANLMEELKKEKINALEKSIERISNKTFDYEEIISSIRDAF